ncbi:hypothetical protein TNIN_207381 [Trichonephila inaurata madagascariensis]|uniref:Uncharacterized protein n=1 Tax=Trichonephila inaurata madagascariensis TaxID=2747483 RepID=A0A8X6Y2F7_9ARAC|nr:hypothetical protein TNIN_207381 [Trichonephila inaurata madagascariensis]
MDGRFLVMAHQFPPQHFLQTLSTSSDSQSGESSNDPNHSLHRFPDLLSNQQHDSIWTMKFTSLRFYKKLDWCILDVFTGTANTSHGPKIPDKSNKNDKILARTKAN